MVRLLRKRRKETALFTQFSRFQNWPLIDGISRMQLSHEGKQRRDQDFLLRRMEVDESFILRYDKYRKFRIWNYILIFTELEEFQNVSISTLIFTITSIYLFIDIFNANSNENFKDFLCCGCKLWLKVLVIVRESTAILGAFNSLINCFSNVATLNFVITWFEIFSVYQGFSYAVVVNFDLEKEEKWVTKYL